MKRVFMSLLLGSLLLSCKDNHQDASATADVQPMPTEMVTAKEGSGKVTLQYGGKTQIVEGKCGGDTTSGDMIIAVQDKTVPAKIFTISFNGKDYPETGKAYIIRKSDFMSDKPKPANEVYIGFSEITQKNQMDWSSDDASGTLRFEASGDQIQCTFNNIKLQPSRMYNKGEMNQPATASGIVTFYKN